MKSFITLIMLCLASAICRATEWHAWEGNASLPTSEVYALSVDSVGRLLIGTAQGLYVAADGDEIRNIKLQDKASRQPTVNRIEILDGSIYVRTLMGSYLLEGDSVRLCDTIVSHEYVPRNVPAPLQDKIVKDMAALRHGWKAYATNSDGIYLYRRSTGSLINMRRSLDDAASIPGNHISSVAYDTRSGRLYASIYHSGIYYSKPVLSGVETLHTGIEENISSFAIDGKGRIWTAYDGAGIDIGNDTVLTALPSSTVTKLLTLPDGNVLAASYGGGIFKVDTLLNAVSVPNLGSGSEVSRCRAMAFDSSGKLWIASFSNGVVRHDFATGNSDKFDISNSALKTNYITDMCSSPCGDSIFVATHYGVYAFDALSGASLELETSADGDERIVVDQLAFSTDGTLYFATPDGLTDRHGTNVALSGIPLIALESSSDSTLWCSTDSAVYHVDMRCQPPHVEVFAKLDGLRLGKYALFDTGDGTVLAGAFGAVAVISSDDNPVKDVPDGLHLRIPWWVYVVIGIVLSGGLLICFLRKQVSGKSVSSPVMPGTVKHDIVPDAETEAEADSAWLKSIDSIIDENIADAAFSIEELGHLAGMSRSNLYKRVKAITGLSPLEYLRERRVKKGRQLLEQATGKHVKPTLSEIAYQVGMSPRQFSKYLRHND